MVKKIKNIIVYNLRSFMEFEFVFKLLTFLIFSPIFLKLFCLIIKTRGYTYLNEENILEFLLNPYTIILSLILLLLMTFYTLFDISAIIIMIDSSMQKKKIGIKEVIVKSFYKSIRVFQIKNIPLIFLVMFLIPFFNIGLTSSLITTIKIPEFIIDYIISNFILFIIFISLIFLLLFIFLRWIYALYYYILEDCDFKSSISKSIQLSKKSHLKDFFYIIIFQMLITIFYTFIIMLGVFLIYATYYGLKNIIIINSIAISIIWFFIFLILLGIMLLSTPLNYIILTLLFYKHKKEQHEKIHHIEINYPNKSQIKKSKWLLVKICLILLFLGGIFGYTNGIIKGKYSLTFEKEKNALVTAHRGASKNYPENTFISFEKAKDMGADWIELDIQQTKDHKIIVIHDSNLKRTTGINKHTWELTYDEIQKLDAGSFLNANFSNERIPLFEDVIKWAKENDIKLNIELKPTGKETDFEKRVIKIIKDNNYQDNCVIASQIYKVLERVKKYDKDIETVYVMALAVGDLSKFTKADNFSIEASSINKNLVSEIHENGKKIYAWTINTEENVNKMLNLGVDNIITDDIDMVNELVSQNKSSDIIKEYIKILEKLFK